MERRKMVRRRRLVALVVLSVVMVWMAGCAVGQSYGLSSLMSSKKDEALTHGEHESGLPAEEEKVEEPEGAQNGSQEETAESIPDAEGEPEGETAVYVPEEDGPGTEHGILTPGSDADGEEEATEAAIAGSGNDSAAMPEESKGEDAILPEEDEKRAALTFDDGPDPKYTTAILDILKEKGVKATFFVVGTQVEKYPEIMKRIEEEGHAVGNHSFSHKDLSKLSEQGILDQIERSDEAIDAALGYEPELFRAPYGAVSDRLENVLEEKERRLVGWTVDTRDWAGTPISDMRELIRKETEANGIILMHSFGGKHIRNTVEMLPDVIDDLHNLGFTLVTVDQIPE